jgi:adenylate kinase family enzyme
MAWQCCMKTQLQAHPFDCRLRVISNVTQVSGNMAPQRIMIVGQPGAGKSTLARRLGLLTGLPVVHIDKIHWQAGWRERSKEEKTRLCLDAEQRERWIFEGGHSATWRNRLARADMLIWLDLSVGRRLWRVTCRAFAGRGETRPDMAEDCPERLHLLPEFLHFIWATRRTARLKIANLIETATSNLRIVQLRSDQEIATFLRDFWS